MRPKKNSRPNTARQASDDIDRVTPHASARRQRKRSERTPVVAAATPSAILNDRQAAEDWLTRHGMTTRETIECTPSALLFMDQRGGCVYANRQASQLLGYTHAELILMGIADITLDEDQPEILRLFEQMLCTGTMRCELLLKHRNGDTVPVDFNGTLLPQGGILVVCRDIGEVRLAKVALKRGEGFEESVLDSVSSAIAVLDRHGEIIAVNAEWRRFAQENGGKQTQLGVNFLRVCQNSRSDEQQHEGIRAVLEGRLPRFSLEYSCLSAEQQRWFSMSVTPLKNPGNGVVITHTDVSAAKLAEQERARQRDALVREVHHRIKNNLQGVAGLLQRELGKFCERDPRLQAAISQVDAIAIVHGLQSTNSSETISLSESVKNICKAVSKLSRHPVPFHRDDRQGVLSSLRIDNAEAVAVALIVNELILNAAKHSPEGSTSPTVTLHASAAEVQLTIANAGKGIPAFASEMGQSLGTGLRLVRSLMPKQGACLTYEFAPPDVVLTRLTLGPPLLITSPCPK